MIHIGSRLWVKKEKLQLLNQTPFKFYCSICLIIRDENEYLKEWLDWHISVGIEHFYIYDNNSEYPVGDFIKSLGADYFEKVTLINWGGSHDNAQPDAYKDCLKRFAYESRWIGFIDTDEHVRVKSGQPLPEFLRDYEQYAGLFVVWLTYNANGQRYKSALPLRQRFTRLSIGTGLVDSMGKVFVQPLLMKDFYIHNGKPIEYCNIVGEYKDKVPPEQIWKENATTDLICIDHYFTKSYEEWLKKLKRGSCDTAYLRKYEEFFYYNPDMEYCRENVFPEQVYEPQKKVSV